MKLTEQQREILANALVEDLAEAIMSDFDYIRDFIETILCEGRTGFDDYTDEELIEACRENYLDEALEEAGVEDEES